jgi:transketolase
MGDQINDSVDGMLTYVPKIEFENILKSELDINKKVEIFSHLCRINVLYMIAHAGSGHIGSSFSSMEIMSYMQLNEVSDDSIFFSSKGHDAPALYSTLIGVGKLEFDLIHRLRRIDGLPGHPDIRTPNVITNTGSLGMGISKAKGLILASRLNKKPIKVTVLVGDGELQEGQLWESLFSATNNNMHELTIIVDHNKLQSDTLVAKTSDLGNIEKKFQSFGLKVFRCDGHNIEKLSSILKICRGVANEPQVIIADTIKGRGVSFMENTASDSDNELYKFHSGAPNKDDYQKALKELKNHVQNFCSENSIKFISLASKAFLKKPQEVEMSKLIPSYSQALIQEAEKNEQIVVLDADLALDTGLIEFKKLFPNRFIECGIAEQDMVSQAGGLALSGLLPIVHSFASFLSSRPNEQIYNNATEGKKIIYVGSLAGVIPGGPGHSHQAVRDLAALGSMPGLDLIEPANAEELKQVLNWAITQSTCSTYIRLVSAPWPSNFAFNNDYKLKRGVGNTIIEGERVALISYGPIFLSKAVQISEEISTEYGIRTSVINLPWLNNIDEVFLLEQLTKFETVFTIDNHFISGGQGEKISAIFSRSGKNSPEIHNIGVNKIPLSGNTEEVLRDLSLDNKSLKETILKLLNF